jgi:hypothetical protein
MDMGVWLTAVAGAAGDEWDSLIPENARVAIALAGGKGSVGAEAAPGCPPPR